MSTAEEITHFAIYPSIGIARVGDSRDGFFFGPELPGPHPRDPDLYRDREGRIKRQAARFRVYGLNSKNEVVKEITGADARVTWKVQVANTKAAWYDFDQAFDVPASSALASSLRNPDVTGERRSALAITPSPRSICGANVNAGGDDPAYAFEDGRFFDKCVYLGELRTDAGGRLVFLGGRGKSGSWDDRQAVTFANNPGWHDDVSDGPVEATVEYQGCIYEAVSAWVVVGPPNYAPGIQGMITGYDLLLDAARSLPAGGASSLPAPVLPERPSFWEHVYPLLRRLTTTQWVNAGFARDFGFGTGFDFESPEMIAGLSDPGDASRALREAVFALFRHADYPYPEAATLPPYYGDAITLNVKTSDPREWAAILPTQHAWLKMWASGDFMTGEPPVAPRWEALSAAEQARLIDRGVLDETLGGAFHPGAEFTWPMRNPRMYSAPFRIKRRAGPEPSFGAQLVASTALAEGGPLDGSVPGAITRWMAVPWQTDTASCLSGYTPYVDDYLPTFWPARVPNDVLTEQQYRTLLDPAASASKKEQAFKYGERVKWLRGITYAHPVAHPQSTYPYQRSINQFIVDWPKVGIIVELPGPDHQSQFPATLWVETGRAALAEVRLGVGESLIPISEYPRFRRE